MIFWLFVALALDKAQLVIANSSYGLPYCGVGAVDGTNERRLKAPMAYRVLVPWLIYAVERLFPKVRSMRLSVYEAIKIGLFSLALWAVAEAAGVSVALLVGCLLSITYSYDYWDWAVELSALALAVAGNFQGALIGGIAAGLSRETAPLVPLTYLLATGNVNQALVIGIATVLTMLGVRLWVGSRPLYCERFMWKRNLIELTRIFRCSPWYLSNIGLSALITVLLAIFVGLGRLGPTWPVPLLILALGWTMGIAFETRVFTSCLLWLAIGLLHG